MDGLDNIGRIVVDLNFELLRKQKLELLECLDSNTDPLTKNVILSAGNLEGLVLMIDAIQDGVVHNGIKTEAEVFGEEVGDETTDNLSKM